MICTDRKMVHPDDKFSCLNKPLCRHILFLYMLYKIFAFFYVYVITHTIPTLLHSLLQHRLFLIHIVLKEQGKWHDFGKVLMSD